MANRQAFKNPMLTHPVATILCVRQMYQTRIISFNIVCTVHTAEINLYNQTYMLLNVYKTDE